jgi:DNA-binding TFAR19-related protein (PDSD5 family)
MFLPFASNRPPRWGILQIMTELLAKALEAVRQLSPDEQDEIARAMLSMAGDEAEPEEIDPAHLTDVLESLAQAKRREFSTEAEIEAIFRRFDR